MSLHRFCLSSLTFVCLAFFIAGCKQQSLGTSYHTPYETPYQTNAPHVAAESTHPYSAQNTRSPTQRPSSHTQTYESTDVGLGTAYGEQLWSQVHSVSFTRANFYQPDVVFSFHYNHPQGVHNLAQLHGQGELLSEARMNASGLSVAVLDAYGSPLPAMFIAGHTYAIGAANAQYRLGIENHSSNRHEVVVTVDGLDVLDGQSGSLHKRGYIVEPYTSFMIDGWRTSEESVAAFRFSPLYDSYAARTGQVRNVGVIGFAFFREQSRENFYDLYRRNSADPFPGS